MMLKTLLKQTTILYLPLSIKPDSSSQNFVKPVKHDESMLTIPDDFLVFHEPGKSLQD